MKIIVFILLLAFSNSSFAEHPVFQMVMIDGKTEKKLGDFPYPRKVLAKAIRNLSARRPKLIVLKFFLDLPKDAGGDSALAESLRQAPVALQALLDDSEKNPNPPPEFFVFTNISGKAGNTMNAESGILPLPIFVSNAFAFGFVNFRDTRYAPLLAVYRGSYYPSLTLSVLAAALGEYAEIHSGRALLMNRKILPLNEYNEILTAYPVKDEMDFISFMDVLENRIKDYPISNKIIIIGYEGKTARRVQSASGPVSHDRLFYNHLIGLYQQLR